METLSGKTPRDYQLRCVENINSTPGSVLVQAPTGSGKMMIAAMLINEAEARGEEVIFLAPRRELIYQCCDHLRDFGITAGMILSKEPGTKHAAVQVCSKDTLAARTIRRMRMVMPAAKLVIVDECHMSVSAEWKKVIKRLADPEGVRLVGFTATPGRADGKGLGVLYDRIHVAVTYKALLGRKLLVPTTTYAPSSPDMRGIRTADWDQAAAEKMSKAKLVGDILTHWRMYGQDRQTVIYASNRAHSRSLANRFQMAGVRTEHLDAETPLDERKQMLSDLQSGAIQCISNCDVLTYGWDCPPVSCLVHAAPTRSLVRYRQRSGRAMRPFDGKEDVISLDHAGSIYMHGYPDDDIVWPLSSKETAEQESLRQRVEGEREEPEVCSSCGLVFYGRKCPACGSGAKKSCLELAYRHGLLRKVTRKRRTSHGITTKQKHDRWISCLYSAARSNRTFGSLVRQYERDTGVLPWNVKPKLEHLPDHDGWKAKVIDVIPEFGVRCKSTDESI